MPRQRGPRGEGSVVPVPDPTTGATRYRIKIPYRDVFDRPKMFTKLLPVGTSKPEAHRERRRLLNERDAGRLQQTQHETVGALLTRVLEAIAATGSQNTADTYRRHAQLYIIPAIGHLSIGKLERRQVRKLLEDIVRDGKQPTAAGVQSALVRALDVAMDEGTITENVAQLVKISSIVKAIGAVPHRAESKYVPPADHVALLLEYLAPHPIGLLVALLAHHGLRLAEAIGFAYSHLDRRTGGYMVQQNVTYSRRFQLGPTKSRETRLVVLHESILARLAQWEAETLERRVALGRGAWLREQTYFRVRPGFPELSCDLVFTRDNGRPFLQLSVRNLMVSACETLGIPTILPHDLRYFVDTQLARARVDDATRRGVLGHDSASMDKIYVHTDLERLRGATEIMAELLQKQG